MTSAVQLVEEGREERATLRLPQVREYTGRRRHPDLKLGQLGPPTDLVLDMLGQLDRYGRLGHLSKDPRHREGVLPNQVRLVVAGGSGEQKLPDLQLVAVWRVLVVLHQAGVRGGRAGGLDDFLDLADPDEGHRVPREDRLNAGLEDVDAVPDCVAINKQGRGRHQLARLAKLKPLLDDGPGFPARALPELAFKGAARGRAGTDHRPLLPRSRHPAAHVEDPRLPQNR
ncbi:hypothetical protein ETD83_18030 [Actinomadura soli]|uniref:Uncharacterized protein n=1 Tax=Actinomadura soli TaxID=2508997 RepID=A0A5C4JB31_9ACTN|nr:hypothetical protein [Actinomadura soli]TMQ99252.1 hypothetical protein ETD83_18030 [Actinomadura soli]